MYSSKTERYFQPEIERMPLDKLSKLQNKRLLKQVLHAWHHVPYYRNKMMANDITPNDIKSKQDLYKLPFLSKADLCEAYPYGLIGCSLKNCVRIHSTSGTTSRRILAFYTQHDIEIWEEMCARALVAAGCTKDDVVQVSYGYGLFTGGAGLSGGSQRLGSLTIPMSTGNTEQQIMFIKDLSATILCCTPSYAAFIGETMKDHGMCPDDIPLKAGIFGAEAWSEAMRRNIEATMGIKAYDIYGLTELCGPGLAFECSEQRGMHVNEDYFIPEIIDPKTGKGLPDGNLGELVLTTLDKEAFPLIRYRTGDICSLTRETCSCGRTHIRMTKIKGRSDDMLIIRGVNVFPSQIETVLLNEGYSANFQIIVDRVNDTDTLDVRVEMTPEMFTDNMDEIDNRQKKIVDVLQSRLGLKSTVTLVAPRTIDRCDGKSVRVIDTRKIYQDIKSELKP